MNKMNTLISGALALLAVAFFVLIVYVSILGDNHKINFLVTSFFEDLKARNYTPVCRIVGDQPAMVDPDGPVDCQDFCFLVELAFLSQFDLLDQSDYSVEIKRDHFWIPYLTGDRMRIDVAFVEKKKNMIHEFLYGVDSDIFVRDVMVVERRNGQWEIAALTLEESSLYPLFNELTARIDLERYVMKTEKGFTLKGNDIRPEELSRLELRLLEFSLFKLSVKP